jgi:hypothetical protein
MAAVVIGRLPHPAVASLTGPTTPTPGRGEAQPRSYAGGTEATLACPTTRGLYLAFTLLVQDPVGADNAVTSRDLQILVDQATKPVTSSDADGVVLGRRGSCRRWSLAEGPVRAVGGTNKQAAADLGVDESTVDRWRARFVARRLEGLHDEPRPGRPPSIRLDQVEDVIVATLESAPGKDTH